MIAGLPGTGIGGIFYLLLAAFMPVREFFRLIQKRTNFGRWCFIALQMGFVFGIISLMWAEVWGLNQIIMWLKNSCTIDCLNAANGLGVKLTLRQAKILAYASASGSLISLGFVFICVHMLRLVIRQGKRVNHGHSVCYQEASNTAEYCIGNGASHDVHYDAIEIIQPIQAEQKTIYGARTETVT